MNCTYLKTGARSILCIAITLASFAASPALAEESLNTGKKEKLPRNLSASIGHAVIQGSNRFESAKYPESDPGLQGTRFHAPGIGFEYGSQLEPGVRMKAKLGPVLGKDASEKKESLGANFHAELEVTAASEKTGLLVGVGHKSEPFGGEGYAKLGYGRNLGKNTRLEGAAFLANTLTVGNISHQGAKGNYVVGAQLDLAHELERLPLQLMLNTRAGALGKNRLGEITGKARYFLPSITQNRQVRPYVQGQVTAKHSAQDAVYSDVSANRMTMGLDVGIAH